MKIFIHKNLNKWNQLTIGDEHEKADVKTEAIGFLLVYDSLEKLKDAHPNSNWIEGDWNHTPNVTDDLQERS